MSSSSPPSLPRPNTTTDASCPPPFNPTHGSPPLPLHPPLNPLAKEFIPGASLSAAASEGFGFDSDARTPYSDSVIARPFPNEVCKDSVNDEREQLRSHKSDSIHTSGGLSTALKRGNGNISGVNRSSECNTDGQSNQTVGNVAGVGRRPQFMNANYLLNFQYDRIIRPPTPRIPYIRKLQKIQPFNKELFLQANFRFLVSDYGDYLLNTSDPDKMVPWEDVAAVNVMAPVPIQCPICLESPPLCPQITSCGHIFCFPCILRFFSSGKEQQKNDYYKKCPLCFAMTSTKGLRTVLTDNVHNYQVGDYVELTLLNRAKGSVIPFFKSHPVIGALPYSNDGRCHPFSKFTLTSDADHITSNAISELSSWAQKAQSEGGDEIDMIPYVFLAIEELQERKSVWDEHRVSEFLSSSPPVRQRLISQASKGTKLLVKEDAEYVHQSKQDNREAITAEVEAAMLELKDNAGWNYENAFSDDDNDSGRLKDKMAMVNSASKCASGMVAFDDSPSSWEDNLEERMEKMKLASVSHKDLQQDPRDGAEDSECYAFYQCADGQPLILHPLNMKCMLQHYGSYENLPSRLKARILEMETQIQTDGTRKRYRYLSHLPLTTNFWFCELDLRGFLPGSAFSLCIDEIRSREMRRRRRSKQEHAEKARSERICVLQTKASPPIEHVPSLENVLEEEQAPCDENIVEPPLNTEPAESRRLFSQVTRLGFASAHDAPDLISGSSHQSFSHERTDSKVLGLSFADVIQSQSFKSITNSPTGANQSSSKKSKKASKVILSTAGGRRY